MSSKVIFGLFPEIGADPTGQSTLVAKKGMFVIVFMLGTFLVWSLLAPIHGAVVAAGTVKIVSNRKTIQHLEGGEIQKILVKEGDYVKENQPLVLLEDTKTSSDVNILTDQLNSLRAKEARLTAEKLLQSTVKYPEELLKINSAKTRELLEKENSLFKTKRSALMEQISLLQQEIEHAKSTKLNLDQQVKSIRENIKFKQDQLQMRQDLYAKNFVGKTDVLNYQQALTDKQETLSQISADITRQEQQTADLQLRIVSIKSQYVETADNDLKDTVKQILEIQERIRPAELELNHSVIRSPLDGQVIDMKITTKGGVVRPSEPLMDIVPQNHDVVISVQVKTTDIDQVHLQQKAKIQLSAYNYKTVPLVNGEVVYVATDALTDARNGSTYYPASIKILPESYDLIKNVEVTPGMPAEAFIQTKSRTFAEYYIEPVVRGMRKTFREE